MNKLANQILIIFIVALSSCSADPTAEELFLKAEKLENQSKYKEAIPILNKAIEKDPKFLGAYINLGADYAALGEYNKAIAIYNVVIKKDRMNQLAQFNIGINYMSLEKYQEAVNAFNKILNDENGNPIPEIIMTDTEGNIGEFQVRFHEVSYERGLVYYELKNWNLAIDDFRRCIENNYLVPESRYMCGAIYEINGEMENACTQYSLAAMEGDKMAQERKAKVCK
jgi:tetratricopeptide (TPR) repeat protein